MKNMYMQAGINVHIGGCTCLVKLNLVLSFELDKMFIKLNLV
jgi:hypothetical protein